MLDRLRREEQTPGDERASQASLAEVPLSATDGRETKRGREKKQPLLEYLRRHMEELRPALPQGAP